MCFETFTLATDIINENLTTISTISQMNSFNCVSCIFTAQVKEIVQYHYKNRINLKEHVKLFLIALNRNGY